MRKIIIENKEVEKLLHKQKGFHKEAVELSKRVDQLNKDLAKNAYQIQKIKDKMKPSIDKLMPTFELQEFELVTNISLNQEKEVEVTILDEIEEYQKMIREKRNENTDNK